ncbi:type I restriction enzyme HsdR N-terminal domain-containing protein [Helicobacter cetorum]|uniref:type I restriction enzyme HsdR N-terminal domain-containing protein n=1 Tax=Helicobacter cetorum TaxID=138563 RepID=UPI0013155F6A|nr:type I restriction enzyme HsdR N-terminal domain-containing protein [Helicobacter cetorum]
MTLAMNSRGECDRMIDDGLLEFATESVQRYSNKDFGEQQVKNSLIMPFLKALNYDCFDPNIISLEYRPPLYKGQQACDYIITSKNKSKFLVEAKAINENLNKYINQLASYFNASVGVRIAILTNGVQYWVFSDLKIPNLMDEEPFLKLDLLNLSLQDKEILEYFTYENFDASRIIQKVLERKCYQEIKDILKNALIEPNEKWVNFISQQTTIKEISFNTKDLIKKAFNEIILEQHHCTDESYQEIEKSSVIQEEYNGFVVLDERIKWKNKVCESFIFLEKVEQTKDNQELLFKTLMRLYELDGKKLLELAKQDYRDSTRKSSSNSGIKLSLSKERIKSSSNVEIKKLPTPTPIYYYATLSSDSIKKLIINLLKEFKLEEESFRIKLRDKKEELK